MKYYLSLGANLGDRKSNLEKAVSFLKEVGVILKVSTIYETEPVDMALGTNNFYNLVLCVESEISPALLLSKIKEFEKSMGRDINNSHKLPRPIDIDILLAGDLILNREDLIIPHKEMARRAFVLVPLVEIAPDLMHPVLKKPVIDILQNLEPQSVKKI
jgi:2-amino-4-hydroxy-6-hydroxymethyldihydropteridine diphosphokinase